MLCFDDHGGDDVATNAALGAEFDHACAATSVVEGIYAVFVWLENRSICVLFP